MVQQFVFTLSVINALNYWRMSRHSQSIVKLISQVTKYNVKISNSILIFLEKIQHTETK